MRLPVPIDIDPQLARNQPSRLILYAGRMVASLGRSSTADSPMGVVGTTTNLELHRQKDGAATINLLSTNLSVVRAELAQLGASTRQVDVATNIADDDVDEETFRVSLRPSSVDGQPAGQRLSKHSPKLWEAGLVRRRVVTRADCMLIFWPLQRCADEHLLQNPPLELTTKREFRSIVNSVVPLDYASLVEDIRKVSIDHSALGRQEDSGGGEEVSQRRVDTLLLAPHTSRHDALLHSRGPSSTWSWLPSSGASA